MFAFSTHTKEQQEKDHGYFCCSSCGGGKAGEQMTIIDFGQGRDIFPFYGHIILCPKCRNTFAKRFWKFQKEIKEKDKQGG